MRRALALCVLVVASGCGDDAMAPVDGSVARCETDVDCGDGVYCNGEESCVDGLCTAGEPVVCADDLACTDDYCDEALGRCVFEAPDEDGDGHAAASCGGDDCDDADGDRYPGNTEVCDADDHDEDCDDTTYGFRDSDGDGFPDARCCNGDSCGNDCDDTLPSAHPGEAETCDGFDNDCDGTADEGVQRVFYTDGDGDGFGDPTGDTMLACFTPEGFASGDTDCDDSRGFVRPGGVEQCDLEEPPLDEDCDGEANPDSLCNCEVGDSRTCAEGGLVGVCGAGTQSCDTGAWGACSIAGSAEVCDGEDDDCDGVTDEGLTVQCWADGDGDGFALAGSPERFECPDASRPAVGGCPVGTTNRAPVGAVDGVVQFECDDADPAIRPDQAEICNSVDDDCDGAVDEGTTIECFVDADGDSYPPSGALPMDRCPGAGGGCPGGFTDRDPAAGAIDCDDGDVGISPAVAEACNGDDDDCDGSVDEGATLTCFTDGDGDSYAPASATPEMLCAAGGGGCPGSRTSRSPAEGADCDDGAPAVNPTAGETCNGDDDDCDSAIDEGVTINCYVDADGDGFAASGATAMSLCAESGGCPSGFTATPPTSGTDCDDGSPSLQLTIRCWVDGDDDGYADLGAAESEVCASGCPAGATARRPTSARNDCDDADPTRSPAVSEVCDGVDEDCDGVVDDGFATVTQWPDLDGDGFGDGTGTTSDVCVGTPGFATQSGDCYDRNGNVFPTQGAYFTVPPCDEIAGERTCSLSGGRLGCRRGGTCVEVDFEYDCSATVEANLPAAACSYTGAIQCFGPSDCTATWMGTAYDYKAVDPPCGQEVTEAAGCDCTGSTSCGVEPRVFSLPVTLACH
jgi:hypothetical protein